MSLIIQCGKMFIMNERDIRTIENMARTGMELDDLCKA